MHEQYDIGETAVLRGVFVDAAGDLADPTAIALTVTEPDGTQTVKAIGDLTNVSTGIYTYAYTLAQAGVLSYRWVASGNNVSVDQTEYLLVGASDHDGPCDLWLDPTDVFACRPSSAVAAASRDYLRAADCAAAATRILYLLSQRRYPGICSETVRPCRRARWSPASWGSTWNTSWGLCGCSSLSACGCAGVSEIKLGGDYPVLGIERVRVDGSTVASSAYRVDDGAWLVRIDGSAWPSSQDLSADPASETSTFDVAYWYGRVAPEAGVLGAKRLASELYAACAGTGGCSLPQRLQTLTRAQETISFIDPQEFLDEGRTGLYEVDLFLEAERYGKAHQGTVVGSPDFTAQLRRT